jgi:hypothetical protein
MGVWAYGRVGVWAWEIVLVLVLVVVLDWALGV